MQNMMEFPNTFDEFAKEYGFTDTKQIYTNDSELIPVFRVKQWLEHIKAIHYDASLKEGPWIIDLQTSTEAYYICSECRRKIHLIYPDTLDNYPYCHCGARMVKQKEKSDKESTEQILAEYNTKAEAFYDFFKFTNSIFKNDDTTANP